MRRLLLILLAPLLVLGLATSALAAPHFVGKNAQPVCTVSITGGTSSTVCKGELAGLGNEDLLIDTQVEGFAIYQCQNRGGHRPPGQNKVLVGPITEPTTIDSAAIKNGRVQFVTNPAVLSAPATVTSAEAGCPNPNYTGVNPTLTVTSVTTTISQGGAVLFTCRASDPNGLSGTVVLTC